jgi:16S rRNA G966 N2-methylase RsmD
LRDLLVGIQAEKDGARLRTRVRELRDVLVAQPSAAIGRPDLTEPDKTISLRRDIVLGELDQIAESLTIERARYYLQRLINGIGKTKTSRLNDINLHRWKEYDDILTDSLWVLHKRDNSGAHIAEYWGNFIPQIPHQMMLRYTKKNDWVLDTFAGSGTTLIEGKRLGRHCLGIELSARVAKRARELIAQEPNPGNVTAEIAVGDNRAVDLKAILTRHGVEQVQLVVMHPPYHDIIKFSADARDLSNAKSTDAFLQMFGQTVDNATSVLQRGRYLALVIGDKYSKGDWIPLGFRCMETVLARGYQLKSIIVKNFEETKGKRTQQELWRYRALVGGFYVFKHEYIFVFKKI